MQSIQALREKFDEIYETTVSDVGPPRQRLRRAEPTSNVKSNFRVLFCEIIDTITQHMQIRFSDYTKIGFINLLDSSKFADYRKDFPDESFKCLLSTYGFAFDDVLLKNQLVFLYTTSEFQGKSPIDLLEFFCVNPASKSALSQIYFLCTLVNVIPVSTSSVERSFSSLKRIKSYARNKMGQERLSELALISIESRLLTEVMESKSFQDAVIAHFAVAERRLQLTFK